MRGRGSAAGEGRRQVLAIGPFPPAVTGAAKNTAIVCDAIEARGASVRRLPTNNTRTRADHVRSLLLYADRIVGFVGNFGRIVFSGRRKDRDATVYLVPDGGLGVAFSAAYARAASAKYPRMIVHHRSYNHIRSESRLMHALLRTAPHRTLHVFLDPIMEERFKSLYSTELQSTYVPNAATCDVEVSVPDARADTSAPIIIGFLSNLVEDKGFDVVAEAFLELNARLGPKVQFLLAGRPVGGRNSARLDELHRTLGERLDYRGEVFGEAKTAFFKSCDIFLFPTRHSQEAQPNVLYEALAGGSLIVSTSWAGIPWILEDTMSTLVEPGPHCADDLAAAVEHLLKVDCLQTARMHQIDAFRRKKKDADARYNDFLDIMLGIKGSERDRDGSHPSS